MPSASASVLDAVSICPWVKVPLMLTAPVAALLGLATATVAALVIDSAVPSKSV